MKVLITRGQPNPEILDSYDIVTDLQDLDAKVPNAVATHIDMYDILDYLPNRIQALQFILNKVRRGGRIVLSGTDLMEVSRNLFNCTVNLNDVQNILFAGRLSMSSVMDMKNILGQLGLKVLSARFQNSQYVIMAERTKNEQSAQKI